MHHGPVDVARLWALLAALLLAAAAALATADAGSAAYVPPRVTVITDSTGDVLTSVPAARAILAAGLDLRVDTRVCRKVASPGCAATGGPPSSVLDAATAGGTELGSVVVVQVGYNDLLDDYRDGLDRVMQALRADGVAHVIWVTLREAQPNWAEMNAIIREAPSRWPTLTVADWASRTVGHPEWFVNDPHLNDAGGIALATLLHARILDACGPSCVPPEPLATLLAPAAAGRAFTVRWRGNDAAASYEVGLRRAGGTWATVARKLQATSYRIRLRAGARMQVRVRALDAWGAAGRWSAPATLRAS